MIKYLTALLIASTAIAGTTTATLEDYRAYCTDTNPTDSDDYIENCVAYLVDTQGADDD